MPETNRNNHILVLGAGNFGTCLAQHLAEQGNDVTIWTRSREVADIITKEHRNPKYLSNITLSKRIRATDKIDAALVDSAGFLLLAIPTQSLRDALQLLKPFASTDQIIVCAAKGIENKTLALPIDIVFEVLGEQFKAQTTVLSGPSFASEIVTRQPTAVSVAGIGPTAVQRVQTLMHAAHFRVYTSGDPIGLEVAGAVKNVFAIATGAARGIGFQANSIAALITRALAEMTRFGVALGANPLTFVGLGGVGDLFLTCTSEKSRNFSVGFRLGKGEPLNQVISTMGSVAEGVATTKAAFELAQKLGIDAPITAQVYNVLYQNKPIVQAVTDLITREAKAEITLPDSPS